MKYIVIMLAIPLVCVSCSRPENRNSGSADLRLDEGMFDTLFAGHQGLSESYIGRTRNPGHAHAHEPVQKPDGQQKGVFAWPVNGRVLTRFRPRAGHEGIEIAARPGEPVRAASSGTVMFCGFTPGLGNTVIIRHAFDILSVYGYLSDIQTECSRRVIGGDTIGKAGESGSSSGCRVHFMIYINYRGARDPLLYLGPARG